MRASRPLRPHRIVPARRPPITANVDSAKSATQYDPWARSANKCWLARRQHRRFGHSSGSDTDGPPRTEMSAAPNPSTDCAVAASRGVARAQLAAWGQRPLTRLRCRPMLLAHGHQMAPTAPTDPDGRAGERNPTGRARSARRRRSSETARSFGGPSTVRWPGPIRASSETSRGGPWG